MIRIGERAPDFRAEATDGTSIRLSDLRGSVVVLYFFPRAFTPGCTQESRRFGEVHEEIQKLGGRVIGVSSDKKARQKEFAESLCSPFPMIGDESGEIGRLYGVRWPLIGVDRRATFVIDAKGIVRGVHHYELDATRHVEEALGALRELAAAS